MFGDDLLLDAGFSSILTAATAILHRIWAGRIKKKRKRRFWIHPTNAARRSESQFFKLFADYYRNDADKFFSYMRMSPASFDKLFALLVSGLTKDDGPREPISAKERLVSTLYFLSHGICQSIVCSNLIALITGVSLAVLAHNFRIGKSTLSNIVSETSQLIWDRLQSVVIKTLTTAREWQVIADRFEERWHFPHCIGVLDGKHCNIQAPPHSGSLDFNHHQQFSVNLTALCDADYNFVFVDVGAYGHCNDAGVFDTSKLGRNFANDRYDLPTPSLLPGSNHRVPYFVVGDDIYPLKQYLMKPYFGRRLTKEQRI
jgi:hypothetical protein